MLETFALAGCFVALVGSVLGRVEIAVLPLAFVPFILSGRDGGRATTWMLVAAVILSCLALVRAGARRR